jgi:hypothetical protein
MALVRTHGLPTALFQGLLARLGLLAIQRGEYSQAQERLLQVLHVFSEVGDTKMIVWVVEGPARLAVAQGKLVRAVRLFAWAAYMRPVLDYPRLADLDQAQIDRDIAIIHTQLDETTVV